MGNIKIVAKTLRLNLSRSIPNVNCLEKLKIVDSMPLEICKNARANRSTICKENVKAMPDKGFCASQQMYYYGYKLHAVCSITGVFTSVDFTPASVHDIQFLQDIKTQ